MGKHANIPGIRNAVRDAARDTLITRVFLFGSRARGDATDTSDIDLCVEADKGFSLVDAGLFADAVERACGHRVDVVSDRFLYPATRRSIHRDRVLVYERQETRRS